MKLNVLTVSDITAFSGSPINSFIIIIFAKKKIEDKKRFMIYTCFVKDSLFQ